jgi:hypothetical protein
MAVTTPGRPNAMLDPMDVEAAPTGRRRWTRRPSDEPRGAAWARQRGDRPQTAEYDYMLWTHIGSESVFFYPPGSVEEHLVTEHGVPSVNMHWQVKGCYDHERDHLRQREARLGAIGDLLAVRHPDEAAA